MRGVAPVTRIDVANNSYHRSTCLHGLRLINNNYTSNGTGRDWCIFGDPGYDGGRRTPPAPSASLPPTGDRPPNLKPKRKDLGDGRKPVASVPRCKDGSSKRPLPAVVQRWQRQASAPSALDAQARCGGRPTEPKEDLPLAHFLTAAEQEKLDSQFKPNLASYPFHKETFPVDKHQYYSERPIVEAKIPHTQIKKLGPTLSTYTSGVVQQLDAPVIHKHAFFSEGSVRDSPHFQTTSPFDGLAKPRKAFGTQVGSLTASLAALPRRMEPGMPFPFGAG